MENNKNFLKFNLIRLRNKAGLTQDQLANAAHNTLTGYQKIEYGRSSGKAKTIADLAKALGVTVEDLYSESEIPLAVFVGDDDKHGQKANKRQPKS